VRWRGKNDAPNQSGVIACNSVSIPKPEDTTQISSPFKAWPAIEQWNRYYTLPTIGITYSFGKPSYKFLEEQIIRSYPQLRRYRSSLISRIEKDCKSLYGYQYNAQAFFDACTLLIYLLVDMYPYHWWADDLEVDPYIESFRELMNVIISGFNSDHGFSLTHETGHLVSFSLKRPAITKFQDTWSLIELVLQQAAIGSCDGFWENFVDLNRKLARCITESLTLEELRAISMLER
jgi:hypothetical protein